ncbi:MAG: hypothetical protein ABJI96_16080 [Paracoccaceae bacterium]
MKSVKHAIVFGALMVSACASDQGTSQFRSFDLKLVHPSPYSTYIGVGTGSQDAKMPRLRQLDSKEFNRYLRENTGCVYDQEREIHPYGGRREPAGYMVPIVCL